MALPAFDGGLDDCIFMEQLDSLARLGPSRDYVEMQWLMLPRQRGAYREKFLIAQGRQESATRSH